MPSFFEIYMDNELYVPDQAKGLALVCQLEKMYRDKPKTMAWLDKQFERLDPVLEDGSRLKAITAWAILFKKYDEDIPGINLVAARQELKSLGYSEDFILAVIETINKLPE